MISHPSRSRTVRRVLCHANASLAPCVEAEAKLRAGLEAAGFQVSRGLDGFHAEPPEVLVVLGGDGFLMETLRRLDYPSTPVFGLNFGSVGFLMNRKLHLADFPAMLGEWRFVLEEHSVLEARLRLEGGAEASLFAFNDIVCERMTRQSVRLGVYLDGVHLNEYAGDGFVLSTTAGSTAYNLAARGPVVHPALDVILVTPLYPHRASPFHSMQFSLVMPVASRVRIVAEDLPKRRMRVVGDGESVEGVESADIADSGRRVVLLRPVDHIFVETLSRKFIGE